MACDSGWRLNVTLEVVPGGKREIRRPFVRPRQ